MAYVKTLWVNREVERPFTYTLEENGDGTTTLIPAEGEVTAPGTPIIASNLNKIENQLEYLDAKYEELFISVSSGKSLVANAITQMSVPTAAAATFATMATNIRAIKTGLKFVRGTVSTTNSQILHIGGLPFPPRIVIARKMGIGTAWYGFKIYAQGSSIGVNAGNIDIFNFIDTNNYWQSQGAFSNVTNDSITMQVSTISESVIYSFLVIGD